MVSPHDAIRSHIEKELGMESESNSLDALALSEWSTRFEHLMRNRLIMGALRYGIMHGPGTQSTEAHIISIQKRLDLYRIDGNLEHMVDVANLCLVEFRTGDHRRRHFKAQDDNKETQVKEI